MSEVLGITGLIGSGKSVVREALTVLYDLPCFDSDTVAKRVYFDPTVAKEIEGQLGFSPVTNGVLNREALKEVLARPSEKSVLEAIVHRAVAKEFDSWKRRQRTEWVGIESAILFTSGFNHLCNLTIAVEATEEVRHQRVRFRDHKRSMTELQGIEAIQAEEGRRQRKEADIKIDNNGTSSITRALEALWERITNR